MNKFAKINKSKHDVKIFKTVVKIITVLIIVAAFIWQMSIGKCPVP
jgi:heme/copper-type cytochrome/quinol oxidase subunit 4